MKQDIERAERHCGWCDCTLEDHEPGLYCDLCDGQLSDQQKHMLAVERQQKCVVVVFPRSRIRRFVTSNRGGGNNAA